MDRVEGTTVFLGLGGNLGDPHHTIMEATKNNEPFIVKILPLTLYVSISSDNFSR